MYEFDDEIMARIRDALKAGDVEAAEEIVEANIDDYEDDLTEVAFRIAVQTACLEYVEKHYEDVELNDEGIEESSSYLQETDDEAIIDFLMSVGAIRSMDEYSDCKFAVETVNGMVLAFDPRFQREVFEKLLEKTELSEEKVVELLENSEAEEYELPEDMSDCDLTTLQEACDLLLVTVDDGKIDMGTFDFLDDSVQGWTLRTLVENLGWECEFEGERWRFETRGVYFIK